MADGRVAVVTRRFYPVIAEDFRDALVTPRLFHGLHDMKAGTNPIDDDEEGQAEQDNKLINEVCNCHRTKSPE